MKTKIVYVVTSNTNDVYLEQLAISAYSLRLHNPEANVIVVMDTDTYATITSSRSYILKYVSDIIPIECPSNFDNLRKSRYLKTMLRELVSGDYLFIDTDTVITKVLDDIDNIPGDVLGVPDKHLPIQMHHHREMIEHDAKMADFSTKAFPYYINSGVMLVRDTPLAHSLYAEWHDIWLKLEKVGLLRDQPALAKANENLNYPIGLLPDTWNCQVVENGLKYLSDSYIIHYFASVKNKDGARNPYLLHDEKYYEFIKRNGDLTDEIKDFCKHPFSLFVEKCIVITDLQIDYLYNHPLKEMEKRYPKLFHTIVVLFGNYIKFKGFLRKVIKHK